MISRSQDKRQEAKITYFGEGFSSILFSSLVFFSLLFSSLLLSFSSHPSLLFSSRLLSCLLFCTNALDASALGTTRCLLFVTAWGRVLFSSLLFPSLLFSSLLFSSALLLFSSFSSLLFSSPLFFAFLHERARRKRAGYEWLNACRYCVDYGDAVSEIVFPTRSGAAHRYLSMARRNARSD